MTTDVQESVQENDPKFYMPEVFKKWHKYGFISVRYWPGGQRVQIEIGGVKDTGEGKKVDSLSKCYVNVYDFLAYLYAEINGDILHLYPKFETEDFKVYGGNKKTSPPTSRVFTAGYWKTSKDGPVNKVDRSFRCAEYEGVVGKNGEISPDFSKPKSFNYVQMKIADLAHLYQKLNSLVNAYAIQKADQVAVFDDE